MRRLLLSALLLPAAMCAQPKRAARPAVQAPAATIAVFDTSMGRIACTLLEKEAPALTANFIALAEGTKPWRDPYTLDMVPAGGRLFYDGTALAGIVDGIRGGDRMGGGEGAAGPAQAIARNPRLGFDRPGRLAAATHQGEISASFFILTLHADAEFDDAHRGEIFGNCDAPSVAVAAEISHTLMQLSNHPAKAVALNHISIVRAGQPLPPVATETPAEKVQPQPVPLPLETLRSPTPTGPDVRIATNMGAMNCTLFTREAPIATDAFIGLVNGTKPVTDATAKAALKGKNYYTGLHFNRVLPDFMIQQQDYPGGAEGPGFRYSIEPVPGLAFDRAGRMAIANSGPDINDSSFFITLGPAHSLDNKFTIFGQCDDTTVQLADRIAHLPRDAHNRPLQPVTIESVEISAAQPK